VILLSILPGLVEYLRARRRAAAASSGPPARPADADAE
jgi:hypothetical protein